MNSAKALLVAVSGAAFLLVPVFVGSASATVLCAVTTEPGKECENRWLKNTEIDSSLPAGQVSRITSTAGTVLTECTKSASKLTINNPGDATTTVEGSFVTASLTWANCKVATTTLVGGTVEIHHIEKTDNGQLTGKGTKVTVDWAGQDCIYGLGANFVPIGEFTGTVAGVAVPVIHINAVLATEGGPGLCPPSVKWTATFQVTSPVKDIFVLKE